MTTGHHRHPGPAPRRERGAIGGLEVLPFGLLVFVVGTLIVAHAWAVVDAKLAAETASREASRAYVEAGDQVTAERAALAAAHQALTGAGRSIERSSLTVEAGPYARCGEVAVTVTYSVPVLNVPFIGSAGHGLTVRGTHHEVTDPHASGFGRDHDCGF